MLSLEIDRLAAKLIYAADASNETKSVCKMLKNSEHESLLQSLLVDLDFF